MFMNKTQFDIDVNAADSDWLTASQLLCHEVSAIFVVHVLAAGKSDHITAKFG